MDGVPMPRLPLDHTPSWRAEVAFFCFRATLDDPELSEEAITGWPESVLPALEILRLAAFWPGGRKACSRAAADNLFPGLYVSRQASLKESAGAGSWPPGDEAIPATMMQR